MADSPTGSRIDPGGASIAVAPAGILPSGPVEAVDKMADMHGGPDYVDEWMEQNLPPDVIDIVRSCCTSFLRWDLLRQLRLTRYGTTAEFLARTTGASPTAVSIELDSLAALGVVSRFARGNRSISRLRQDTERGQALLTALRAYEDDREFRFALVYSIVRESHRGAELD
jgi:hypothetical protein